MMQGLHPLELWEFHCHQIFCLLYLIKNVPQKYLKQVCIYGFNYEELQLFKNHGRKSLLEQSEDIEILRFLDLNRQVLMFQCENESLAVDVPTDVKIVEDYLKLSR